MSEKDRKRTFGEGLLRSAYCLVIGAVGFWFPLLYFMTETDPRYPVLIPGLLVFVFAFRTSDSFYCAYQNAPAPIRAKWLPAIVGLLILCWAPVVWCVLAILIAVVFFATH